MAEVENQNLSSPEAAAVETDSDSNEVGEGATNGAVKVGDTAQGKKVLATRVTGTVKWFNVKNGYGFISRNDKEGEDVFVHQSAIRRNNPTKAVRSVGDGEVVEFDIVEGEKGNEAANVTGPNGATVKGSPFAADRGRFYSGRGRGFRHRGAFRPRGPPREGLIPYGGGGGGSGGPGVGGDMGGQMMGGGRGGGGGYRPRGRGFFRRRFFRQEDGDQQQHHDQSGDQQNGGGGGDEQLESGGDQQQQQGGGGMRRGGGGRGRYVGGYRPRGRGGRGGGGGGGFRGANRGRSRKFGPGGGGPGGGGGNDGQQFGDGAEQQHNGGGGSGGDDDGASGPVTGDGSNDDGAN